MPLDDSDQVVQLHADQDGNPVGTVEQNGTYRLQVAPVGSEPVASVSITRVAISATAVTLKASNVDRKRLTIANDGNKDLYVKLGASATLTDYTVMLDRKGGYYELPFNYTGAITGIWSAAGTGGAQITEAA